MIRILGIKLGPVLLRRNILRKQRPPYSVRCTQNKQVYRLLTTKMFLCGDAFPNTNSCRLKLVVDNNFPLLYLGDLNFELKQGRDSICFEANCYHKNGMIFS